MFERPSTFNRFAVAYSCSFVRFEPLDAAFLARELAPRAVVFALELPLLAAFCVPPAAFFVAPEALALPLLAALLAREPPALAVFRAPPAALRAESPAVFRVPLAALRTEPAAAVRVPLTAFRVPLATFRAEPEALAVPLLAASFARAVPLLDDFRVALAADLPEPVASSAAERARLAEERTPRAEVRASPELRELSSSPCSLCSLSPPWPISLFATLTAAGTATPSAAPATTFFVVDIPSSSGSISHTSHLSGSCLTYCARR
jgi:hypothetical protein